MSAPIWFTSLLQRRSEVGTILELSRRYFSAPAEERLAIQAVWDAKLIWDRFDPFRVSYPGETSEVALERIKSLLLYHVLGMERDQTREDILVFGTSYNMASLLGGDADRLFLDVSSFVGSRAREALSEFVARTPQEKGLAAFGLRVVDEPDGGRRVLLY